MGATVEIVLILGGIALFLGIGLGIADKFLKEKEDPRIPVVMSMLPNFNCGSCGNPGCHAMAESLLQEDSKLTQCKPGNEEMRLMIKEYLETTPGPDGSVIKVKM